MIIWFFQVKKNKGSSMSPVVSPIKISPIKRKGVIRAGRGRIKVRPVANNAFSLGFVEFYGAMNH